MAVIVVCVLRSGGRYGPEWVWALRRGLNRHLSPHRFACLTDVAAIPATIGFPLRHRWPGWWSKIEIFRPGLFDGPVLYLDLDTLVVGDLEELASWRGEPLMLADLTRERRRHGRPRIGESGVMLFTPGPETAAVYEAFASDPEAGMSVRMDGKFIREHMPHGYIQDHFPGQVVSLKYDAEDAPPVGARLVCAHGSPKFDEPEAGWAYTRWRNQ